MCPDLSPGDCENFHISLERILACDDFLDRFYDSFIASSDEIKSFFKHSDMARQKRKLATTLRLITMAVDDSPGADMYLEYLGKYHRDINVNKELYELWLDALIDSARHCDPGFDDNTESLWRQAIRTGIAHMHKAYE